MKKLLLLVIGVALAAIMVGCTSSDNKNTKTVEGNKDPVEYVAPKVISDKIENGETFAFVVGSETCSACTLYKETALTDMDTKSNVKLEYIEVNGIENKKDEFKDFLQLVEEHLDGQFGATPTTYFITDGVLSEITVGAISYDELTEIYNKNVVNADKQEVEETEAAEGSEEEVKSKEEVKTEEEK